MGLWLGLDLADFALALVLKEGEGRRSGVFLFAWLVSTHGVQEMALAGMHG